jgi:hypothetical protein
VGWNWGRGGAAGRKKYIERLSCQWSNWKRKSLRKKNKKCVFPQRVLIKTLDAFGSFSVCISCRNSLSWFEENRHWSSHSSFPASSHFVQNDCSVSSNLLCSSDNPWESLVPVFFQAPGTEI